MLYKYALLVARTIFSCSIFEFLMLSAAFETVLTAEINLKWTETASSSGLDAIAGCAEKAWIQAFPLQPDSNNHTHIYTQSDTVFRQTIP